MTSSARPLRIVTVVPSLARNTGGPAVTLVEGTRAMSDSVHRVVYATDASQPAATRPFHRLTPSDLPEGAADVRTRIFRTRPPYGFGFSPGLWYALRRDVPRADLVTIHSLNLFPQYAAFTEAIRAGVPYIVTPHGSLDPWLARNSRFAKRVTNALWQRRMLANAAAIHFTTEEEADRAGDLAASTPHVVLPNGVDISRFSAPRPRGPFRTRYLDGFDGHVVLFLGRIAKKKGIDLLIRGFAAATSNRDARLVIAGPDDESLTQELAQLADRVGIRARVRFIGPVYGHQQLDALAAADVWALTSHTENFGNAVIEAMAAGCPVLVSTEVNLAPQIEEAQAGVVTQLSVDTIASSLRLLLDNSELRERLASSGRALAQTFNWSVIAPELVQMFNAVASDGRRTNS